MGVRQLLWMILLALSSAPPLLALPALPTTGSSSLDLAVGKPVESNAPDGIASVNDGKRGTEWGGATPVWVTIDLQQEQLVNQINVIFYSDGIRYYRYHVEVSPDGQKWTRVVDDTKRTRPAPGNGDPRSFASVTARYVRLTVTESFQAWGSAQVSEIEIFGPAPEYTPVKLLEVADQCLDWPKPEPEGGYLPDLASLPLGAKLCGDVPVWLLSEGLRTRAWSGARELPVKELVQALALLYVPNPQRATQLLATYSNGSTASFTLDGPPAELTLPMTEPYNRVWKPATLSAPQRESPTQIEGLRMAWWDNPRPEVRIEQLTVTGGRAQILAITATLQQREYTGDPVLYADYLELYQRLGNLRQRFTAMYGRGNTYLTQTDECEPVWTYFLEQWLPGHVEALSAVERMLALLRKSTAPTRADLDSVSAGCQALTHVADQAEERLLGYCADLAQRLLTGVGKLRHGRRVESAVHRDAGRASSRADRRCAWFAHLTDTYAGTAGKLLKEKVGQHAEDRWDMERALCYASRAYGYATRAAQLASQPGPLAPAPPGMPSLALPGQRGSLCLNGVWQWTRSGTEAAPDDNWEDVTVPHVPSLGDQHFAWYRLKFTVPADWDGSLLRLRFDGLGHYCEVFLNGYFCGSHRGSRPRFYLPVTDVARAGQENTLLVLAIDSSDSELQIRPVAASFPTVGGFPAGGGGGFPTRHFPEWDVYGRFAGIYQDVFLEALPAVHAEPGLLLTSVREKRIEVPVVAANGRPTSQQVTVHAVVRDGADLALDLGTQTVSLKAGETRTVTFRKAWTNPKLWGIGGEWGDPHLYFLDLETTQGQAVLDHSYLRFGFREAWLEGHQFLLNGRPLRVQGYQTLYDPWHGAHTGNTEYMRRHMKLARRANFNTQRLFSSDAYTSLEIADEIGFLSEPCWFGQPEMANLNGTQDFLDPVALEVCHQFFRDWVQSYGNYASAAWLSPENESLAVGDGPADPERPQAWVQRVDYWLDIDRLVKQADPMRRPLHHHGMNAVWGLQDPRLSEFDVVGLHYPAPDRVAEWAKDPHRKPMFIGEWNMGGLGYSLDPDQAVAQLQSRTESVRNMERVYRQYEVALDMPHYLTALATWCASPQELRGPWPEQENGRTVPVSWPSLSGRGCKVQSVEVNPNLSYVINWFDPARSEYTPNMLNDAFRACFDPMPPLPEQVPPGLLVTVTNAAGTPVSGANLFALPAAGQSANPVGVVTDPEGTGWLWLQQRGRFLLEATLPDGSVAQKEIEATILPLDAPPGYDYLQRVSLQAQPQG